MEEIWKPIPGYEQQYEASNLGRIKNISTGTLKKPTKSKDGRLHLNLSKGGKASVFTVHKLIALTFLGPRPAGKVVCHEDGDATNNRIENLRHDTQKGNVADTKRHGTFRPPPKFLGETHPQARLTERKVKNIRKLYATGKYTLAQIGERYGISGTSIGYIINGKTWRHVL